MARKRQIDPEICVDSTIAQLSISARLFYIYSWMQAEDTGVLEYDTLSLKARTFPNDKIDIKPLVQELLNRERYIFYKNEHDRVYVFIKNFHKHQKIQHPSIPKLPLPPSPYRETIPEYILKDASKELLSHTTHILLNEDYNRIELNRIDLSRVEKKAQPYWAAFKDNSQKQMEEVSKGFNIYSLLGKLKKIRGVEVPEEVVNKICASYIKNKAGIKKLWPWFLVTAKKEWETWHVNQQIKEGEEWKKAPVSPALAELLAGILKTKSKE